MGITVFLVFCAAGLAFMLYFLIAIGKESGRISRQVLVRRRFEGTESSGSRMSDLKVVWRNAETGHHRSTA